ncbi:MAG: FUSC family protein [Lacrimispora sp.]|uniref:FUSC family protein n=1 Tax=Lacrimispora sp. TaxID=2719234 RepID=UPI0039E6110B
MNSHKPVNALIPGLGQRSIKTALSTAILALLYLPFGENPTFACIGVIFGMGNGMEDSKKSGGNRLVGTIIGGLLGIGIFWIEHWIFPKGNYYLRVVLIFFGVILLVCASVIFKWPGAVQPGGVVLCIILFNTPADHVDYAFGRMFDTAIGVIFAIAVNAFFTRERVDKWLKREAAAENVE